MDKNMNNSIKELKEVFQNMEGLEKFNWYVLKPIALVLCIGIMIIL